MDLLRKYSSQPNLLRLVFPSNGVGVTFRVAVEVGVRVGRRRSRSRGVRVRVRVPVGVIRMQTTSDNQIVGAGQEPTNH